MRNMVGLITAALAMALVGGCQSSQQPKTSTAMTSSAVLDVKPVKPVRPSYANSQYVTPPQEPTAAPVVTPMYASTPDTVSVKPHHTSAARADAKADAANGGTYKVKKGDTLYRIAKTQYGDGKKWTQIASANPGLSPQSLKVGQTIVVP